ncbi:MAG: hypothetical protein GX801_09080 [Fibrobacter sp.]|nr:hypothetical protein [Fibrobacter sp.]
MVGANKHIEEYLKQYLNIKEPGFAVLIKGGWGSGKKYFIEQFIEFRKHFDSAIKQAKGLLKENWSTRFLQLLENDPDEAAEAMTKVNISNSITILAEVDADEFVNIYCNLKDKISELIRGALVSRYDMAEHYTWLLDEKPFLERLKKASSNMYNNTPKPFPASVFRLYYLNQRIDKALKSLQRVAYRLNTSEENNESS